MCIFTGNFVRCFSNNLASSNNYLHKLAVQKRDQILELCAHDNTRSMAVVYGILGVEPLFDTRSKSNLVKALVSSLDEEEIARYLSWLMTEFEKYNAVASKANKIKSTKNENQDIIEKRIDKSLPFYRQV